MKKDRRCVDCGMPSWGERCRAHALAHASATRPLTITQEVRPSTSWWTESDFTAAYQRELPRMLAVKVAGTPTVNVVLD